MRSPDSRAGPAAPVGAVRAAWTAHAHLVAAASTVTAGLTPDAVQGSLLMPCTLWTWTVCDDRCRSSRPGGAVRAVWTAHAHVVAAASAVMTVRDDSFHRCAPRPVPSVSAPNPRQPWSCVCTVLPSPDVVSWGLAVSSLSRLLSLRNVHVSFHRVFVLCCTMFQYLSVPSSLSQSPAGGRPGSL